MATRTVQTLATINDAAYCDESAKSIKAGENAAFHGMLIAAIFLKVRGDTKVNRNLLENAFAQQVGEGSAVNYVSKARACAMPEHFAWNVDVNRPLGDVVDELFPEFRAYWGALRDIKKSKGKPPKARDTAKGGDGNASTPPDGAVRLPGATPAQVTAAFLAMLSRIGDDGNRALDTATLASVKAAIEAEIAARAAEMTEMAKAA